jgi:hypothetical protein
VWTASTLGRAFVLLTLTAFPPAANAASSTGVTTHDRAIADTIRPQHELIVRTVEDRDLARWAIERFRQAGLKLPSFTIVFHDKLDACHGYYGYFQTADPPQIDICGFNNDRFLVTPRKVTLHEMAHAWVSENVDDATIEAFLELRGLSAWNDGKADWEDRGSEQAAEVIAWALLDEEHGFYSMSDSSPEAMSAAYELLTGNPVPAVSSARSPVRLATDVNSTSAAPPA